MPFETSVDKADMSLRATQSIKDQGDSQCVVQWAEVGILPSSELSDKTCKSNSLHNFRVPIAC